MTKRYPSGLAVTGNLHSDNPFSLRQNFQGFDRIKSGICTFFFFGKNSSGCPDLATDIRGSSFFVPVNKMDSPQKKLYYGAKGVTELEYRLVSPARGCLISFLTWCWSKPVRIRTLMFSGVLDSKMAWHYCILDVFLISK